MITSTSTKESYCGWAKPHQKEKRNIKLKSKLINEHTIVNSDDGKTDELDPTELQLERIE
jgi:hypothetical protein